MENTIKTAIFDLDGTLINSKDGIIEGLIEAFKRCGLKIPNEAKIPVGPPLYDTILSVFPDMKDEKIYEIVTTFRDLYHSYDLVISKPYEKTVELLTILKENGVKTYIATYKPKMFSSKIMEKYFENLYEDIVSPTELPTWCDIVKNNCTKSDIVKFLIDKHNIDPNFAFMAGDAQTDIQAAIDNKLRSVAINYGYSENLQNADYNVDTPTELYDIVCKICKINYKYTKNI